MSVRSQIYILIALAIIVNFFSITSIPFEYKYYIEAVFLLVIFAIGIVKLVKNYFVKIYIKPGNLTVYFTVIALFLVLFSAVLAKINFGQPLTYGIIASRRVVYCLTGVIFLTLLIKKTISIARLEKVFVVLFIFILMCYYLINFIIPASDFLSIFSKELTKGFVTYSETRGISRYRLDISILSFGIIYSLLNSKRKFYLIYFILGLIYMFFLHRGRVAISSLLFVSIIYLIFSASMKVRVLSLVVSGFIVTLYLLVGGGDKGHVSHLIDFFSMGAKALTGEIGQDMSANSRITQAETAWWFIKHYQYIGVGRVSNNSLTSPEDFFGYLYPSDIGLVGIYFLYGFFGIVAYLYFCIKIGKSFFLISKKDTFVYSCWLYSVYILCSSLITGAIFISAFGQFSIMLAIITFSASIKKNERYLHNTSKLQ